MYSRWSVSQSPQESREEWKVNPERQREAIQEPEKNSSMADTMYHKGRQVYI